MGSGYIAGAGASPDSRFGFCVAGIIRHTAPDGTIYSVGAIELREEPGKQLESADLDGTIYIGSAERISRLYLFYPW